MTATHTDPGVLTARHRRARRDPIATLIATASSVGVKFRISGADLIVSGASRLELEDADLLVANIDAIRERLEPPAPEIDLLVEVGVEVELVTTEARAREVIASLPASVGFDCETEPLPAHAVARPWIVITRDGRPAKLQPQFRDKTALDPHRARPRLLQIYDPSAEVVYVIDCRAVPLTALDDLWSRRLVAHNAAFEICMLHGRPRDTIDTLQIAGLTFGTAHGSRRLDTVARAVFEIEVPKDLQVSDWSAARLSRTQICYAGLDAVLAHRSGRAMYQGLCQAGRRAFAAQNAVVPVIATMRLVGIPFDRSVHAATIEAWERELAGARAAFVAAVGEEVPSLGQRRSAWLEQRLDEADLKWWPRTATGGCKTGAEHLKRIADRDWVRPLIAVANADHRLRAFGHKLIGAISPITGRLHGDLMPCGQKAGRTSCWAPNLLGLPPDARLAVIAPAGRVFVVSDFNQIELRVAAELSRDAAMREVFRSGGDLHRLTAAAISGVPEADVTPEQRQAAKATNFGVLYGQGAKGLRATAWASYGVDMPLEVAERARAALRSRYPMLLNWQKRMVDQAQATGVLRSVLGRPLRAEWEPRGEIRYTLACNFCVQSSAADVLMIAMVKVHQALQGRGAALVLQIHDELLVECAEDRAAEVAALVEQNMITAYTELFPDAPVSGLVDVAIRPCWAKASS